MTRNVLDALTKIQDCCFYLENVSSHDEISPIKSLYDEEIQDDITNDKRNCEDNMDDLQTSNKNCIEFSNENVKTDRSLNASMPPLSQKHKKFVSEMMKEKSIEELPGIGKEAEEKLRSLGFQYAYTILGQFLLLKRKEDLFVNWMKDAANVNKRQALACYNCLKEWCEEHL